MEKTCMFEDAHAANTVACQQGGSLAKAFELWHGSALAGFSWAGACVPTPAQLAFHRRQPHSRLRCFRSAVIMTFAVRTSGAYRLRRFCSLPADSSFENAVIAVLATLQHSVRIWALISDPHADECQRPHSRNSRANGGLTTAGPPSRLGNAGMRMSASWGLNRTG